MAGWIIPKFYFSNFIVSTYLLISRMIFVYGFLGTAKKHKTG